jgi:hypothetical protein
MMQTPEPQQRLSGAFINPSSQEVVIKAILEFLSRQCLTPNSANDAKPII